MTDACSLPRRHLCSLMLGAVLAPFVAGCAAPKPPAAIATTTSTPHLDATHLLSKEQIAVGFREHAALAQLHRWYQIYENPAVPMKNSLDILSSGVVIDALGSSATGHAGYQAVVAALPKNHRNAHFVRQTTIKVNDDGSVALQAEVDYANLGAMPEGQVRAVSLGYETLLTPTDRGLPEFSKITIKPTGAGKLAVFADAYPENRAKSVLHYYLSLVEDPSRRLEPFREIFADRFSLDFSGSPINDFASFETWFRGPASSVAASTHRLKNFQIKVESDKLFTITVDMDWQGIRPDGSELVGGTRHHWVVVDDPRERFARIQSIKVETLSPFGPRPAR